MSEFPTSRTVDVASRPLVTRALLLLALLAHIACESWSSVDLTVAVREPPYPRARCAKGPVGLGRIFPRGRGIAGAEVVLKPTGLRATTGGDGRATIRGVPRGQHTLYVEAPGFRPAPPEKIQVPGATPMVKLQPCVSAGPAQLAVGFEQQIVLRARNLCGATWDNATYRWTQVEGPKIDASAAAKPAATNGATLAFTTTSLVEARGALPPLPQVLSFSHDEAGEYVFRLDAKSADGRLSSHSHVLVTATSPTTGVTSVAPFYRYYFLGAEQGPWEWVPINTPKDWKVLLDGASTRTPSIKPIPPGPLETQQSVTLYEKRSGLLFSLTFGYWNGVPRDCGRTECHAAMENHWKTTRHATSWQRLLDGKLELKRGGAAESCAECHSLGYDRAASNGGYDDVADELKVSFPERLKEGNYAALPPPMHDVSNVYCLACHGPARVDPPVAEQPGLFATGVCARCHDRKPEQTIVAEWKLGKHAKTVTGALNGPERREECTPCHTAQGFYYRFAALSRPPAPRTAVLNCCENPAPISCQACHNAMIGANPTQLHRYGMVTTTSGLTIKGIGSGAQCALCHNAWKDPAAPATIAERAAPHAPQADLSYGRAGYALPAAGYPALSGIACAEKTEKSCVTCHMYPAEEMGRHTFRMAIPATPPSSQPAGPASAAPAPPRKQNVGACLQCHEGIASFNPKAKDDYDGDGGIEGIADEIDGLMAALKARLDGAIQSRSYRGCDRARSSGVTFKVGFREQIVITDNQGQDLGDCDDSGEIEREENPFHFPEQDLLLHKAAYNYLLLVADGSRGLHNAPYAVKLLQRTIAAVSRGKDLPKWTIRR